MTADKKFGKIVWTDLTIPDAAEIRDFYEKVVGWESNGVDVGDYQDFNMLIPGNDTPQAGICHQRGQNAALPAVWMVYIQVDDLKESLAQVEASGGVVLVKPHTSGENAYAVIKDPAGAVCALVSTQKDQ